MLLWVEMFWFSVTDTLYNLASFDSKVSWNRIEYNVHIIEDQLQYQSGADTIPTWLAYYSDFP